MAVERAGGRIITGYFDLHSVIALKDPLKFFERGELIETLSSYQISHLRCTNSTKASTATGSDGILQQPCQQGIPSLPKVLKAVSLN